MSTSSSADPRPWGDLFRDRRVIVTGGGSGIGQAIALGFVGAGARVLVTGAQAHEAEATQNLAASLSGGALDFALLDVRDASAIDQLFEEEADLAALVNCAGVIRRGEEMSPDVFAEVIDINLTGTMRCCTAARPALTRGGGAIVNLASMLSFFGGGLVPGYSASKGGIAQLTKSLAIAWAAEGIRVNALAPGWIRTPLTSALQADEARSRTILDRTPLGRWGEPGDMAGPAMFLCSPFAAFITGAVLPVDGGYAVA